MTCFLLSLIEAMSSVLYIMADMGRVNNHIDYVEFPAKDIGELEKIKEFFGEVFDWSYTMYGDEDRKSVV